MSSDGIARLADALARFGRVGLCTLPTPLEPMTRLSRHLAGPRLWVKREDCTGPGFGGNKLRKLDYVLHEALQGGVDTLVSGGVVQSNSQRQVAAAAARLGLACHLAVYHGRLASPGPEYEQSGNALLNRLFGALGEDAWLLKVEPTVIEHDDYVYAVTWIAAPLRSGASLAPEG